jgi:hypothetical protein
MTFILAAAILFLSFAIIYNFSLSYKCVGNAKDLHIFILVCLLTLRGFVNILSF